MSCIINGSAGLTTNSGAVYDGISSGTSVTASGTSVDFTSIPSWVKRITVMFNSVSTNGASIPLIRLGTGGTPTTTGYVSSTTGTSTASAITTSTTGFIIYSNDAAYAPSGIYVFNLFSGNTWVGNGTIANSASAAFTATSGGVVTLGGVLNMVRITTVNGTDTFDAGSINILFE